jgi:hypothetical protein
MGGWKLEVGRMVAYIALPIVCFYLFNKPEYFKEYVAKNKQYYLIKEETESVCLHVIRFSIVSKHQQLFFLN